MSQLQSCVADMEDTAADKVRLPAAALDIPLMIVPSAPGAGTIGIQPLSCGIPLPKGKLRWPLGANCKGLPFAVHGAQLTPLATWSDGSLRWVLVELLAAGVSADATTGVVRLLENADVEDRPRTQVWNDADSWTVRTAAQEFEVSGQNLDPFIQFRCAEGDYKATCCGRIHLVDKKGRSQVARTESTTLESAGPLRTTIRLDGQFPRSRGLRFRARISFFAQTGLVRLDFCIHNPHRARHRGGLWDLGDCGSRYFKELSVEFRSSAAGGCVYWQAEPGSTTHHCEPGNLEIYQDSSGGESWQSPNHVNAHGRVPCRLRGYRERSAASERTGLRASPTVAYDDGQTSVAVATPEFWQQFPKSIDASKDGLRVGLFPRQWDDLFELQGGERKTHTVWMLFEPSARAAGVEGLAWVHSPARICPVPEWVAATGAIPELAPAKTAPSTQFERYVAHAIEGPHSFFAGRERIDEYGWRNDGEVWADHEGAHYPGRAPIISHYNNQFDVVYGAILQWLRTADARWWDVLDPLARHVMDIDIYHTDEDRAAYNGGLFWFTDHYLDAQTATHRTYSRSNRPKDARPYQSVEKGDWLRATRQIHQGLRAIARCLSPFSKGGYGGGPSSEHNFATGLLHYYYLTGDPDAREAVLGLAEWVIRMDDGALNPLGLVDDGPTGLASAHWSGSKTAPGRGGANSVQVLLDAWQLSNVERYLAKAEELIRRCIHPADDVASMDLLDAENHWSYTMFLAALARYLLVKAQAEQLDAMYGYAQSSLLHYARWMLAHERPYLDARERLEYATETWPAQDLRKANVLKQAARHADAELGAALVRRADELAQRAWRGLLSFENPWTARALALVMVEGTRDAFCAGHAAEALPQFAGRHDFAERTPFIPQKRRVREQLRTVPGLLRAAKHMLRFRLSRRIPRELRP